MSGEARVVRIVAKRKAPPEPTGLTKLAALLDERIETATALAVRREMVGAFERIERIERLLKLRPIQPDSGRGDDGRRSGGTGTSAKRGRDA